MEHNPKMRHHKSTHAKYNLIQIHMYESFEGEYTHGTSCCQLTLCASLWLLPNKAPPYTLHYNPTINHNRLRHANMLFLLLTIK